MMGPVPPVTEGQCALNGSEANRQWGSVTFSSATFKRLVSFFLRFRAMNMSCIHFPLPFMYDQRLQV